MLATTKPFCVLFCVQSPVLFCVFHSPSVSCFTEPFLFRILVQSSLSVLPGCLIPDLLLVTWLSLCLALWILFADRRPRLFTWLLFCLAPSIPVCHLFYPDCDFWPYLAIKACKWICTPLVLSARYNKKHEFKYDQTLNETWIKSEID